MKRFQFDVFLLTLKIWLYCIGTAAVIGFACSLKLPALILFAVLGCGGFLAVYLFLAEMRVRGERMERHVSPFA